MTKDVIELAREAGLSHRNVHSGLEHCNLDDDEDLTPALVKFADLVAARERERIAEMAQCTVWAGREFADRIRALNTEGEGNDKQPASN
jgi:hypothetical protein